MQRVFDGERFQSFGHCKLGGEHAREARAILPRCCGIGENSRRLHHAAQGRAFSAQRRQHGAKRGSVCCITGMGAGARAQRGQNAQSGIHAGRCSATAGNQRNTSGASRRQPFGAFQSKALRAAQHHIKPRLIRLPWRGSGGWGGRADHQLADMA